MMIPPNKFGKYENTVQRLKGETKNVHILVKSLMEFNDEKIRGVLCACYGSWS